MMKLRKPDHEWQGLGGVLATLFLGFALTACGGGGGGGGGDDTSGTTFTGSTEDTTIDDSNAEETSGTAVKSATSATGSLSTGTTTGGVVGGDTAEVSVLETGLDMARKTRDLTKEDETSGGYIAGADVSSDLCPDGGTAEFTQSGDTSTLPYEYEWVFNDCRDESSTADADRVFDGTLKITYNTDPANADTTMDWVVAFDHLTFHEASSGNKQFGAHGSFHYYYGAATDTKGTMPHDRSGTDASWVVVANIDVVDDVNNRQVRLENAEIWFQDGDRDPTDGWDRPYYLAFHGTGQTASGTPYRSCLNDLGCIEVDPETTTFYWPDDADPYPATGILRVNGADGTWVQLDANTTNRNEVEVRTQDGSVDTVHWSTVGGDSLYNMVN